jgi:hypothetical protein
MLRTVLIVVAVAVLVVAGVVANYRAGWYGTRADLQAAADKLQNVPNDVGPWTVEKQHEMDEKIRQRAEAVGYIDRSYRNTKTSETVRVLMLCGDPGPIGAHTPEICYGGYGFVSGAKHQCGVAVSDGSGEYFSTVFRKPEGNDAALRVCWAWGVDGNWFASDAPRGDFMTRSALYKIYVTRPIRVGENEATADEVIRDFLTAFLPEVKKTLAPQ